MLTITTSHGGVRGPRIRNSRRRPRPAYGGIAGGPEHSCQEPVEPKPLQCAHRSPPTRTDLPVAAVWYRSSLIWHVVSLLSAVYSTPGGCQRGVSVSELARRYAGHQYRPECRTPFANITELARCAALIAITRPAVTIGITPSTLPIPSGLLLPQNERFPLDGHET